MLLSSGGAVCRKGLAVGLFSGRCQRQIVLLLTIWMLYLVSGTIHAQTARVMTWNILASEYTDTNGGSPADRYSIYPSWQNRLGFITKVIDRASPDIIAFQEDMDNQYRDLKQIYRLIYSSVVFSKDQSKTYAGNGSRGAIFFNKTKFHIVNSGVFDISNGLNVTWLRLADRHDPTQRVIVFNAHLHSSNVLSQAEQLAYEIWSRAGSDAVVVLGDFNANLSSQAVRLLNNDKGQFPAVHYHTLHQALANKTINTTYSFKGDDQQPIVRNAVIPTVENIFYRYATFAPENYIRWTAFDPTMPNCTVCSASDHHAITADIRYTRVNNMTAISAIAALLLSN